MVRSARLIGVLVAILVLFSSWADGRESHHPWPPGRSPDEDAASRGKYQKGESSWHPSYLLRRRQQRKRWNKIAPIHFYRRTCGSGEASRQIILRVGQFDLDAILKDDASQMAFLLYIRWLLEAYWRSIVPVYQLEPKPVFIVDFDGITWRTVISNSLRITALVKKMNSAFHSVTGKGWSKTFILNAPASFDSIWKAVTTLVTFRNEGVVVVDDEAKWKQFMKTTGEKCLWEGFGGKSKMPLGEGIVEKALSILSQADDSVVKNPDAVRLTPQAENFPTAASIAKLRKEIAAEAVATAVKSLGDAVSQTPAAEADQYS